ncbi:hypothetical protein [Streptomyces sp. KS_5]|uniref:hypothetical protein n=1 Tax=Streptomyces sp. KS_5 TaxID=1881018 RepID=UPI000A48FFCB|nr:hypothetical protein [Streptomyces sp. KS_5]
MSTTSTPTVAALLHQIRGGLIGDDEVLIDRIRAVDMADVRRQAAASSTAGK